MIRNTCAVDYTDVPYWLVRIGGNYVEKLRASSQFSNMLNKAELEQNNRETNIDS